jgi:predicted 3-demethylubiquinone-9 3-methyltransferase (glyoxalase superfamily)
VIPCERDNAPSRLAKQAPDKNPPWRWRTAGGSLAMIPGRRIRHYEGATHHVYDWRRPMPHITPNLWFDTESEEAAKFYVSVFPNSEITTVTHYGEAGPREAGMVLTVEFVLDGEDFIAINGGPQFSFSEAISLLINCADQEEVDYYWSKLGEGGEEGPCGWLKDRYGLSWQVVPAGMGEMLNDPDQARGQRAMKAMLAMKKIDIAALHAAADAA